MLKKIGILRNATIIPRERLMLVWYTFRKEKRLALERKRAVRLAKNDKYWP
jgi:hypothetical protein